MTNSHSNLPEGWEVLPLSQLGSFSKGKGITKADLRDKGVPCIRYGEIYTVHHHLVKKFYSFVNHDVAGRSRKINFNDLLFAGSGETSEEIGKTVGYRLDEEAFAGGDIVILSLPKKYRSDYIAYYLNSIGRFQLNRLGAGNSVVHIYAGDLKKVIVPLPPKNIQDQIVAILEQWDKAIEKTEALIAAKERRFEWFCSSLIAGIPSVDGGSVSLSDIYEFKKGSGLSKADISEKGKNKCILYGQLYTSYGEVISQVNSCTDIQNGVASVGGDILIPASTTTSAVDLANAAALLEDNVLLSGDINILRPKSKQVCSEFMAYYLTHCKKHDLARLAQGITIIHLYGKDIKSVRVSLPDIAAQRKVAKLLNAARREIDLLKKLGGKYREQKRGLMQKLLTGKRGVKP